MRPDAAAAAALAQILPASPLPADEQLRLFFRAHPSLGQRDRARVGDWIFDTLRNLRLYRELARRQHGDSAAASDEPRHLIEIARARSERAGQAPLAERAAGDAALEQVESDLTPAIRYSLPDWLWDRLVASHADRTESIARALLQPAPIDLRVNLLRGKAEALRSLLAERGVDAVPIEGVPTGLRVAGRPNLARLDLFERGWFEIQDAGSQRIADLCEARRGQLVVDFCAGAGGKTLALSARMRNSGRVLAFDTGQQRLSRLLPRATRAGVDIVSPMRITGTQDPRLARYRRRADVVLVDAPCSGTGTLTRNPELKWRLSPQRLQAHVLEQQAILAAASALVKPGGTLIYATCSLLNEENRAQVDRFLATAATADPPPGSGAQGAVGAARGFELTHVEDWLPNGEEGGRSSGFFMAKWLFATL